MILNIGGEGEPIDDSSGALVVNVNAFYEIAMIRPRFHEALPQEQVWPAHAHATGLPDSYADRIVARRFPISANRAYDGASIDEIAVEMFRVAKPGAELDFGCASCDTKALALAFHRSGFRDVTIRSGGYPVRGRKP